MNHLSFGLVLIVGILAGGLGVSLLDRGPAPLATTDVRGIVTEMLDADKAGSAPLEATDVRSLVAEMLAADKMGAAPAELDPVQLNAMIENYLMDDPAILERMTTRLNAAKAVAKREAQARLIQANYKAIYEESGDVILGNPEGDVTLVEMFDYNCGYCRQAVPDMAALIAEDPNLKIILKEFPILSDGSVEAARVAVLVAENDALDYWTFHQQLFATRGQVGVDAALRAAEAVGGNRVSMMIEMNTTRAGDPIKASYALAEALDISGTPTYIIGSELIPGAVGLDALRKKIANMRACGDTVCDVPAG
jgi:protein-disulfide isomerase